MSQNETQEVDPHLKNLYEQNRTLSQPWYSLCIAFYAILVVIAVSGNSLVLIAMVRSRELRKSARNILIGILATSDLLLSCTMPLTAIDALTKYWPFGKDTVNLCRIVKTSSAVAVYLSSMTLIAIAGDRYHCIVQSSRSQLSITEAGLLAPVLLVISMLMASPIFFHTKLDDFGLHEKNQDDDWSHITYCVEEWKNSESKNSTGLEDPGTQRIYYSIFSMAMQYVIPFVIMASIYLKIFYYLKTYRIVRAEKPEDKQRARRTNVMLFTISMVFCVAWLPLNLIGVLLDRFDLFGDNVEMAYLTFVACHLIGMSSACINPVLYGFLNETFKREFIELLKCCSCLRTQKPLSTNGELQPALELKVVGDTKNFIKVENKLIPRRDPSEGFIPKPMISKEMLTCSDLVTVHDTLVE